MLVPGAYFQQHFFIKKTMTCFSKLEKDFLAHQSLSKIVAAEKKQKRGGRRRGKRKTPSILNTSIT
jgi:hypothetical protein